MPTPAPLHSALQRLLHKRGLDAEGIEEFFSWDLRPLSALLGQMRDLDKAAARIARAMQAGQIIGIYGDYDVDGTTACALWHHFFHLYGHTRFELMQPNRLVEGYGLHREAIDSALAAGVELLITADCGISSHSAAEYALHQKLDLIITDHHRPSGAELPPALAVANPNRQDEAEDSPLRALAGVGVAFALCLEVRKVLQEERKHDSKYNHDKSTVTGHNLGQIGGKRDRATEACSKHAARSDGEADSQDGLKCGQLPSLAPLLPFVAMGTVCDMVPLNFVNQRLVRHGLRQIRATSYAGLKALFSREERALELIPSEKLSFGVGPLINSKGRIGPPERALQLLTSDDPSEAFEHYQHLQSCNQKRRELQAQVLEQAMQQVSQSDHQALSLARGEDWHEGVIGIVASKLVEEFKVPAIVLTRTGDSLYKASARSAGQLSIFDCLAECRPLFERFGGHKAAAGFSIEEANLKEFSRRIGAIVGAIPVAERTRQETFDLEIRPEEITPQLVHQLEHLEPFGNGNPRPRFKMSGFQIESFKILKEVHVRWHLRAPGSSTRWQGISFNYLNKRDGLPPQTLQESASPCAYFTLGINRYRGNEYIQLQIDRMDMM